MNYDELPKVASVLDELRVVVNRGAKDGIKLGQRFLIFALGEEILDPDTGKSLGQIELVRGSGEVVHLQEAMCIVRSNRTRRVFRESNFGIAMGREVEEAVPFRKPAVGDFARQI